MQGEQAAIQNEENVFASTLHTLNASARPELSYMECGLWFDGDGMQNVDATDTLPLNERTQRADDSFDFREFWHESGGSGTRL
jgi:hypothetical protein